MSDEPYELPVGWAWAKIGHLAQVVGGGTPRRDRQEFYEGGMIPWATPTDIDQNRILPVKGTSTGITELGLLKSSARLLPPGTVLFSSRASIGKIGIAAQPMATNQGFANLIPYDNIDTSYLAHCLRRFTEQIRALASGTTYLEVSKAALKEFPIPVPPLSEQRRIVAKIGALFEESRTARQALDRIPSLLKKFRQAVLAAAFRGDLTRDWREQHADVEPASELLKRVGPENSPRPRGLHHRPKSDQRRTVDTDGLPQLPDSWAWCTLEQCTTLVTKGESPRWQGYQYINDGVPFVRSENVLWGVLDLSNVARIPEKFHEKLRRSKLKPNDVLINLVGASIGRCAIVPRELSEANINQAVAIIRTTDTLYPPYLLHLLLSPEMQEDIQKKKVEVARPNISLGDLRHLVIPLAPVQEQEYIASRIENLFAQADAIEAAVNAARRRADKLEQSILARAFRGELVPQDPNDEPASVPLARIRTGGTENSARKGHSSRD